jgi:hypothetical protein
MHFLRDTLGGVSLSVMKTAQVELDNVRVHGPVAQIDAVVEHVRDIKLKYQQAGTSST